MSFLDEPNGALKNWALLIYTLEEEADKKNKRVRMSFFPPVPVCEKLCSADLNVSHNLYAIN